MSQKNKHSNYGLSNIKQTVHIQEAWKVRKCVSQRFSCGLTISLAMQADQQALLLWLTKNEHFKQQRILNNQAWLRSSRPTSVE